MAGNVRVLAGKQFNFVERSLAISGVTVTNENTLLPKANLGDGFPSQDFRFNAIADPLDVTCDFNGIQNGDFTAALVSGNVVGWGKSASATVTQVSPGRDGTGSKVRIGGGPNEYIYYDLKVLPGEKRRFDVYAFGVGGTSAIVRIRNLETGYWLRGSDSTWQTSLENVILNASAAWVQAAGNYTVQPYSLGLKHQYTLRVFLYGQTNPNEPHYDDIYSWPAVNFFSLHGHNLGAINTADLSSGATSAVGTAQGTLVLQRPSIYVSKLSDVYDRFWRLRATGATYEILKYGEVVFGQSLALARGFDYGHQVELQDLQVRNETPLGEIRVLNQVDDVPRRFTLDFRHLGATHHDEFLNEVLMRSRMGGYPIVVVPDDTDTRFCLYGRLQQKVGVRYQPRTLRELQVVIDESPFPTSLG